jgi:hypothetical protein
MSRYLVLSVLAVLASVGCSNLPENDTSDTDMSVGPTAPEQPRPRCAIWTPSRDDAYIQSQIIVPASAGTLPDHPALPDDARTVGVTVAYVPQQEVTDEQVEEMLNAYPFCSAAGPPGVQCQLAFKLNGSVKKVRAASARGGCIEQEALEIAATMNTNDSVAATLMGLDHDNQNFSVDGPLANILFVKKLRVRGVAGNDCGLQDDACAYPRAGGALVNRSAVIKADDNSVINAWFLKHEIGHLHGLLHTGQGEMYVSDTRTEEKHISNERCKQMRRWIPQHFSPWFIALGGSLSTDDIMCQ